MGASIDSFFSEDPNGKSSPTNEPASGDASKTADEITEKSENRTIEDGISVGGTEEVVAEEDEEDADDEVSSPDYSFSFLPNDLSTLSPECGRVNFAEKEESEEEDRCMEMNEAYYQVV